MNNESSELLIITGELSGDLIGASLIKELKKLNAGLMVSGIGGNRMNAEGMNVIYHIDQMNFLGFAEVIRHLPFIREVKKTLLKIVVRKNIRHAVLIDYPGFNLSIAKKLKAEGLRIIYYVSPQVWAWGRGRIKKMEKLVDKMLVVFPFEKEFYEQAGIDAELVGHPMVERIKQHRFLTKDELFSKLDLKKNKEILLLMPGSRKQEIKKIFPESIKAAVRLAEKFNMQVVVACSENLDKQIFANYKEAEKFTVVKGYNYELMRYAKFGIIKSGTSTLEAGYFSLPMIIIYKTSLFTYLIIKQLITLDRIGMVNILLGEKVIPELIQSDANEIKIFSEAEKILSDKSVYEMFRNKLTGIKNKLGDAGASEKAAKTIYELMNES